MTEPKPIETRYAGCRFRSRLEARTAVFFDHLRIKWLYEPEGYEIGPDDRRRRYLPDFYLPEMHQWVEVKGDGKAMDYGLLVDAASPHHGLPRALNANPKLTWPLVLTRLVILGPMPKTPLFHQSLAVVDGRTTAAIMTVVACSKGDPGHSHRFLQIGPAIPIDRGPDKKPWSPPNPLDMWGYGFSCPDIHGAYTAARSARFEHGEQG